MAIEIETADSFAQFVKKCQAADVRLVKLAESAFVEPGDVGGGAVGMIGRERIVLTAFVKSRDTLIRWDATRRAKSMVTIEAGTGRGSTSHSGFEDDARRMRARLEVEGIQVVDGEWTKKGLESLLNNTD